ncbi:DUF1266 domain-containing protein [Gordonia sp. (in: high G+C Gram-positive bacteria)]|uniref:DUF1266 domain-containing protein n=1 Tax=Gordonia sp. (in: high G+C Gram-positive bacteria) TaxID=84139 RepID=UPI001698E33C|nr:DUF1266 domain-containing protein [Gordonia sp. (in: high G+C Gram-positive bacteria)]NLG45226.1 DUF1266 domain-containing protein [Gordonia sp. (in: high G+C Gram-positive bacteria)]
MQPWMPGPREARGLAVGAYFLAGEDLGWVAGIAAAGTVRALRRELRSVWQIAGVVDGQALWAAGEREAVDSLVMDPILHQVSGLSAAAVHPGTPAAAIAAVTRLPVDIGVPPAALPRTVVAWDLARRVQLVRQCVAAGYAVEEEAWMVVASLGDHAAAAYADWGEFARGFEIGRALHMSVGRSVGRGDASRSIAHTRPYLTALLTAPGSPWTSVPLRSDGA